MENPNERFDRLLKAMIPNEGKKQSANQASDEALAHVVTILRFLKIHRKMLLADMNMRALDAALQSRPNAFNGLRGHHACQHVALICS